MGAKDILARPIPTRLNHAHHVEKVQLEALVDVHKRAHTKTVLVDALPLLPKKLLIDEGVDIEARPAPRRDKAKTIAVEPTISSHFEKLVLNAAAVMDL